MTKNREEMTTEELQDLIEERRQEKANEEALVGSGVIEILEKLNELDIEFDEILTETGNAEVFVKSFDDEVRYVIELKQWAYWANQKWNLNTDSEIERKYKSVIDSIKKYRYELEGMNVSLPAVAKGDDSPLAERTRVAKAMLQKMLKRVRAWITASSNKGTKERSIDVAATLSGIPIHYNEFDRKGQFFGVANGVIDLRDGKFIKDKPEYMLLKSSEVEYEDGAECPIWQQTLLEIMEGDETKVDLLQQIAGSCLVGNSKEKMFFFCGDGSNGKSTFAKVLEPILGKAGDGGYKASVSPEVITGASTSEKQYALAMLKGVRMIIMNELGSSDGRKSSNALDDTIVKRMVDSDEGMAARPIRGEPFELTCVATMILNTNYVPSVACTDGGIWRRLVLLNFNRVFSDAEKDRELISKKLTFEQSGILNWCIAGAIAYMANGQQFDIPKVVKVDTAMWRSGEDKLGTFIDSAIVEDGRATIKLTDFLSQYTEWCVERRLYSSGDKELKKQLVQRGIDVSNAYSGNLNRIRGWKFRKGHIGEIYNDIDEDGGSRRLDGGNGADEDNILQF